MTVSPDARTPSASVHALSGSTPPGAGPTMQPFGVATTPAAVAELPDTFAPLDAVADDVVADDVVAGLAARRAAAAHPDAEVVELAGRVVALAEREHALWGRRADLEDAVTRTMPSRPVRPADLQPISVLDAVVDGARVTTIVEDAGWRDRFRLAETAFASAQAEHERVRADTEMRLGLPLVEKLSDRASARLGRWGLRLAAMEPQTQAGLKAKAAASRATSEGGMLLDPWRHQLAASVSHDAIRIIEAEADARWREDQARDGELFSLIARHGPALKAWYDADEAAGPFSTAWWEARPPMPEILRYRSSDWPFRATGRDSVEGNPSVVSVYNETDITALRSGPAPVSKVEHRKPAPWNSDETIVRIELFPDAVKIARKAEILGAWDAWLDEIERLRETTGLNAANAVVEATAERVNVIEDVILAYQPSTFEGLQAKARWIASMPDAEDRAMHLMRDLCRMPDRASEALAEVEAQIATERAA